MSIRPQTSECRWPSRSGATSWLTWKGPHVIFPWMQTTQSKFLVSSAIPDKPSTRFFRIMSCNVSFPGCTSCLWSRSNDGVIARVAESSEEGGELARTVFRKYSHPIFLSDSMMIVPLHCANLMMLSPPCTYSPRSLRMPQERRPYDIPGMYWTSPK